MDFPPVHGNDKVKLELTYGKTLALSDVLHVSSIKLWGSEVKVSFEFDKINNIVVEKEYCDQSLFVLNVSKIISENASSSTI
ncbi:hypothetical protein CR513_41514, partial [Mucuna pruriens]